MGTERREEGVEREVGREGRRRQGKLGRKGVIRREEKERGYI